MAGPTEPPICPLASPLPFPLPFDLPWDWEGSLFPFCPFILLFIFTLLFCFMVFALPFPETKNEGGLQGEK